jgi:hypothetical protein
MRVLVGLFSPDARGRRTGGAARGGRDRARHRRAGVGWLDARSAWGGVLGAIAAGLARRPAPPDAGFLVGIVLWGAPFLLIAGWPTLAAAVVAFVVMWIGNILVDVAGSYSSSSAVDDTVLSARVPRRDRDAVLRERRDRRR